MNRYMSIISAAVIFLCLASEAGFPQTRQGFGTIVGVQAGQVTINWGSNDGVKEGMSFVAFRQNQMVHPQTGEYLSIERDVVGKIEIQRVTPTYSVGRFASTQKTPRVGDLVELVLDESQQYPYQSNQPDLGTITNRTGGTITFNMGSRHGVENGLYFDVMRGGQKIGSAVVSRVSENSSMASLASGEQQVQIGDRLELADQQKADMTVTGMAGTRADMLPSPAPYSVSRTQVSPVMQQNASMSSMAVEQPRIFGTITAINGATIRFDWMNRSMPAPQGILAGIYRQEQLTHPVTGENLGAPLILIGRLRVDRSEKSRGSGTLASYEALPRTGDKLGYLVRASAAAPGIQSSQRAPERPRWESGSRARQASSMNQEVQNLQRELTYLRNLSSRIALMEKSIAEQQKATRSVQSQVRSIRKRLDELTGGIVPQEARLIPEQSDTELFGSNPDKARQYTFRVSDDMKVKLQVQDKTVLVSLDNDSIKIEQAEMPASWMAGEMGIRDTGKTAGQTESIIEYPAQDQTQAIDLNELLGPEEQEEQSFFVKHWKMMAGALGGLLALMAVFMFLKRGKGKPKKSSSAAMDLDGDDEADDVGGGAEEAEDEDDEEFEEEEIEGL